MEKINLLWLSSQHFADGGEGVGGAGATGTATGVNLHGDADRASGAKASDGDLSDVIYGIGEADESGEAGEGSASALDPDAEDRTASESNDGMDEDPDAEFERLIAKDGKFRDAYEKRVRDIVTRRLKNARMMSSGEAKPAPVNEAYTSVFAELARKYKLDANDAAGIAKAFLEDDDRLAEEAMARGMSKDEMKRVKATELELAAHKNREKQRAAEEEQRKRREQLAQRGREARQRYDGWMAEAEELKKLYPAFDIAQESKNPEFIKALQSGWSVKRAYEGLHHDDLVMNAMAYTAGRVEKGTADKIRAGASRPVEGAVRGGASAVHKADVNDLTGADIREILKRVERGENIRF